MTVERSAKKVSEQDEEDKDALLNAKDAEIAMLRSKLNLVQKFEEASD